MKSLLSVVMPRKKRDDRAVKIETEIARQVATMCQYWDKPIAEYLSELLRPAVARDFAKFKKELGAACGRDCRGES